MFKFLVWHVLVIAVSCELFKEESRYLVDYASAYVNYKPKDYHFNYAVSDPHTGDHKSQWEVKTNGVVRGGYSLLEPDGTTRVVEYIADDHGFRAVVNKIGTAVHPVPVSHVPLATATVPQVPLAVPVASEVAHYKTYDGQISNYADVNIGPVLYHLEQNLGSTGAIETPIQGAIIQEQNLGSAEAGPLASGHVSLDAVVQEPKIEAVPLQQQNLANIAEVQGRINAVPLQNVQIVPGYARGDTVLVQGHDLSQQLADLRRIDSVPLQGPNLISLGEVQGRIEALQHQTENVPLVPEPVAIGLDNGKIDAVPLEGHSLERIATIPAARGLDDARFGVAPVQGHVSSPQLVVQDVRRIESVPLQNQDWSHLGGGLLQGQNLAPIPIVHGQNLGRITNGLDRIDAVALQEQALGRTTATPSIQALTGGRISTGLGRTSTVPLQNPEFNQVAIRQQIQDFGGVPRRPGLDTNNALPGQRLDGGQILSNVDTVPLQSREIGSFAAVPFQGHGVGRTETVLLAQEPNVGRIEAILPQGHLERLSAIGDLRVPTGRNNLGRIEGPRLPQPQIEIHGRGGEVRPQVAPQESITAGPSYTTNIDYQSSNGAGNLNRDVYHASYSEKVLKVIPSPRKREKSAKKDFLIYYPDSESH